jgi:hypothetical protein
MRRLSGVAFAIVLSVIASAHVGSPNVLFDGNAGPYPVRVIVRPPEVVPGLAEVIIRVDAPDVERVVIDLSLACRRAGAPTGDDAARVPGKDLLGTTVADVTRVVQRVRRSAERGSGTVIVPVNAFTGRLGLSRSARRI